MTDLDSIRKRCDHIKVYGNATCVPELAGYVDVLVELAIGQEQRLKALEGTRVVYETDVHGHALAANGVSFAQMAGAQEQLHRG
jgi:hypothetical protein